MPRQAKPADLPELIVGDAAAWRAWLGAHHQDSPRVWLVVSKGATTVATQLTFDEALEEALAHGWIEGQARRRDEASYRLRFTPRRKGSTWSTRNAVIAERISSEGRMHRAGLAELKRAKSEGRWNAYQSLAAIEVPAALAAALKAAPTAQATFATLSAPNRYAVLYRVRDAPRPATQARRIQQFVAMLARGETVFAQRKMLSR